MDQTSSTGASFCPKCGTVVGPDDRFCRKCGYDMISASPSPTAAGTAADHVETAALASPPPNLVEPTVAAPVAEATKGVRAPLIVGLVVVALLAVGGVVMLTNGAIGGHTVKGTFELNGGFDSVAATTTGCEGKGGYGDIGPGTPVTVKNEKGELLDTTSLGTGTGGTYTCSFTFMLKVPDTAKFYTFEVGRRGEISNSHEDMVASGWTAGLSLGN
jgi:hypothetical protein